MNVGPASDVRGRVSEQRLGGADGSACRVKQCCVSMSEPMPIHSSQFERLGGWFELPVEQIAPTEWGTVSG
jgi:hypothetical protein